ncbi:hypothetical protein NMY22_g10351 [Coprinellus aureogranulatus]|nr:hypothetical protein NMY22_g10351 [Coprinellus aureogranulatus]
MSARNHGLFSTVTIHGLVATQDGEPSVIILDRKPSFPQPLYQAIEIHKPPEDISALPFSGEYDLEVRVVANSDAHDETSEPSTPPGVLGRGRAGRVYPLEIISIRRALGCDVADSSVVPSAKDLPPLCIKIGTPTYARRLAREAWFYERFDKAGVTGILSPRCYGVSCAPLTQDDLQPLLVSLPCFNYQDQIEAGFGSSTVATVRLPEETEYGEDSEGEDPTPTVGPFYLDDVKQSHALSPWLHMRERKDKPVLTVLIMEKLGEMLTYDDFDQDEEDLNQLLDHLFAMNISHGDERFRNILRVPETAAVHCPQHHKRHKWMFVDWENARTAMPEPKRKLNFLNRGRIELTYYGKNPRAVQD